MRRLSQNRDPRFSKGGFVLVSPLNQPQKWRQLQPRHARALPVPSEGVRWVHAFRPWLCSRRWSPSRSQPLPRPCASSERLGGGGWIPHKINCYYYCGWTKSCTTLKPWELLVRWYLQGESSFQGFLAVAGKLSIHSRELGVICIELFWFKHCETSRTQPNPAADGKGRPWLSALWPAQSSLQPLKLKHLTTPDRERERERPLPDFDPMLRT